MLYLSDFYLLYILALIAAILAIIKGNIPLAIVLIIYFSAGIYVYLKVGFIKSALKALLKGNHKLGEILLKFTYPKFIAPQWQPHYLLANAIMHYNNNNLNQAYSYAIKVINHNLSNSQLKQIAQNLIDAIQKN